MGCYIDLTFNFNSVCIRFGVSCVFGQVNPLVASVKATVEEFLRALS